MKAYGTRSTKTTWSNPERGLLQRSKRICVKDCDSIFLRKIRFTPFPTGKRLHGLHNFDQRIVRTFWARMMRQFPWLNSKDLGTEENHTWGAWDGLADKVHECIQLENDNPQIDVQEKPSNVSLRRFLGAGWVRGCGASQQCKTIGHFLRCYNALHIFIYLYISLHPHCHCCASCWLFFQISAFAGSLLIKMSAGVDSRGHEKVHFKWPALLTFGWCF